MRAEVIVTFNGIKPFELKDILQLLRDFEQKDPERIFMTMLVTAPELSEVHCTELLKKITPSFPFIKAVGGSANIVANREFKQEGG